MAKLKTLLHKLADFLDDVLAYALTVVGILASAYIPLLKSGAEINISVGAWKIALAAVVALLIVGKGEQLDGDTDEVKKLSKAGRKKRFWKRMSDALAQGVMWSMIVNVAV